VIDGLAPSEVALIAATAETLSRPRRDPADSFVLHAPLELTARTLLLAFVAPDQRDDARRRIAELAEGFEAWGPAADLPGSAEAAYASPSDAVGALTAAIERGDVDGVDTPASWIGDRMQPRDLTELIGRDVLPRLGAAGHAPIFLFHLPKVAPRGELTGRLLRPMMRELARNESARIRWIDECPNGDVSPDASLTDALTSVRHRGRPEVDFIAPTMERVDDAETAALLGPAVAGSTIGDRDLEVLRAAARSMLIEPTEFSPYIWTHCLTLPQAALGCAPSIGEPTRALAVAATHVAGFRSAFASRPLDHPLPEAVPGSLVEAIETGPDEAAAVALGLDPEARPSAVSTLATRASAHCDAHYVKYTVACFDAAAADSGSASLYLAAAAKLAGYWTLLDRAEA
jgi:hypothetical protein